MTEFERILYDSIHAAPLSSWPDFDPAIPGAATDCRVKPGNDDQCISTQSKSALVSWLDLKRDTSGVTAMEYALIGSLIAVVIVLAVTTLGTNVNTVFQSIANAL